MATIDDSVRDKARRVVDALARGRWMLGTSESVTGGAIAAALALVDGCSAVLFAAQVPYSVPGKVAFLGVAPVDIQRDGTVSPLVIEAMHASMVARFSSAQVQGLPEAPGPTLGLVSVGVAGVAGVPIEDKPTGHVLLGIRTFRVDGTVLSQDSDRIQELFLPGDRREIITRAVDAALDGILAVSCAAKDI